MASRRAGVDHGLVSLSGLGMICCCRDNDSVELAYAVAELHILHLEGAYISYVYFREHKSINIPGVPPWPLMRACYHGGSQWSDRQVVRAEAFTHGSL